MGVDDWHGGYSQLALHPLLIVYPHIGYATSCVLYTSHQLYISTPTVYPTL